MAFVAGQKLRASELNALNAIDQAQMGGLEQTITTTVADLNSASVSVTVDATKDVMVLATFDVNINGGTDVFTGKLDVDGSTVAGEAIVQGSGRWTVSQHWKVTLTAGAHTLKLRGQKVNNSNTVKCSEIHTRITVYGAS